MILKVNGTFFWKDYISGDEYYHRRWYRCSCGYETPAWSAHQTIECQRCRKWSTHVYAQKT